MQTSLALHIIGVLFWIAGLMVVTGLIRYYESNSEAKAGPSYAALTKKYWFGMVVPGLIISLATGTYQFLLLGAGYYMKQGWFHGKLTMILVLLAVSFFVAQGVSAARRGESLPAKKFGMLHGVVGSTLLIIVFLTYLGRA